MSLRAIKAKARGDLHQAMKVPAYYLETRVADPVPVEVRVHTKFKALGDLKGTSFSYAEQESEVPQLIFWHAELEAASIDLANKAIIMVGPEEGYQIDHIMPRDNHTVTAHVTPMPVAHLTGLPYPGA
jgi:hypothetical protein